jgi:hypothetical protein
MPQYLNQSAVDFQSLDRSVFDINRLTDAFNYRFQGIQCDRGELPPKTAVQSAISVAYKLVERFIQKQDGSTPQMDIEASVEERIIALKVEVRRDQYIGPSWEDWLEMRARRDSLVSQVQGLKAICESAYDFARHARTAIYQLVDERVALRAYTSKCVEELNHSRQ